eukprot:GHVQ01010981.1.p1 GENE.GHVQ01010981.1~~GHVQ01010981.1.p1  ORF type:complete len:609 (-),score=134.86 GHVQ01010981.1:1208-3034(-)
MGGDNKRSEGGEAARGERVDNSSHSSCSVTSSLSPVYVKDIEIPLPSNLITHSYEPCLSCMSQAERRWKTVPPPQRGEVVRLIGEEVRKRKEDLAMLISLENGKILSESRGEVQEFIDVCDLAVGLSRQLEGKVLASERSEHLLLEAWHPLGSVGVITAFNFPVAVFGWNLALALICGNCVLWKPSDTTPLISIALINVIHSAISHLYEDPHRHHHSKHTTTHTINTQTHTQTHTNTQHCESSKPSSPSSSSPSPSSPTGVPTTTTTTTSIHPSPSHSPMTPVYTSPPFVIPRGIICLVLDAPTSLVQMNLIPNPTIYPSHIISNTMVNDTRLNLISFTGNCHVGREAGVSVQKRFGKVLLELGGNNASVVMGEIELAVRGSVFAAVGTCGQRCTSLRRLMVHSSVYKKVIPKLVSAYQSLTLGHPLTQGVQCGPLHTADATARFERCINEIKTLGGNILVGGKVLEGNYVEPTLVEVPHNKRTQLKEVYVEENFSPILFIFETKSLDEAIQMNNSVCQGLSSSLYTSNLKDVYKWIGPLGSDCGIVNVNIGPSGAEIGGAFGGEKHTGGGRESGSDAWKQYMRRVTCTLNCSDKLPLAQGVKFDIND